MTQIVKYHGDFDDDQSIVIAETDYLDVLLRIALDIKFRSDALGKTILFIGYSLSDLNIRFLLHRLWKTWMASGFERDRPQSYVFMLRPTRSRSPFSSNGGSGSSWTRPVRLSTRSRPS